MRRPLVHLAGLATLAAVLGGCPEASACYPWEPGPYIVNHWDGIPADGAVVVGLDRGADPAAVTLSVEDWQGRQIPGSVEVLPTASPYAKLLVFRSFDRFQPNAQYALRLTGGFGGFDGEVLDVFDTVSALEVVANPLSGLEASFGYIWVPNGEEYCCCASVYTCSYGPTCWAENRQTLPTVRLGQIEGLPFAEQWLIQGRALGGGGDVTGWNLGPWLPSVPFRTARDTYCVEIEARSLVGGRRFRDTYCVEHEDVDGLWEVEPAVSEALQLCSTPPPPLREEWCAELVAMCDTNPRSSYDSATCERSRPWCDGEWADREPPEMTYASPMDVCGEELSTTMTAPESVVLSPPQPTGGRSNGDEDQTFSSDRYVAGGGCSTTAGRRSRLATWPLLVFCGGLVGFRDFARRRRRSRQASR